jgi:alkanesulfonate monooxygenase SsuD/methylene tetrahydromethanopterin reductase-like flavin-dependent oxidoreductase (luciferase family)
VAFSRRAESLDFDNVSVSEHHFSDDEYMPISMVSLGAIAGVTSDVRLETYVGPLAIHNPYQLAEDAATVDFLSAGRLALGIGLGSLDRELEGFQVPKDQRVERIEEAIALMREAWTAGPVGVTPAVHDVAPGVSVTPTPIQDPTPPFVIGGVLKPAVKRAARLGDGWCPPASISIDEIAKRKRYIEE